MRAAAHDASDSGWRPAPESYASMPGASAACSRNRGCRVAASGRWRSQRLAHRRRADPTARIHRDILPAAQHPHHHAAPRRSRAAHLAVGVGTFIATALRSLIPAVSR